MNLSFIIVSLLLAALLIRVWSKLRAARRVEYIRTYTLPKGLFERLQKRYPELTQKDCQLVSQGLRQFFLAYLKSGCKFVAMPSQVADDLWHEFILYTKNYDQFCQQAFGCFMHHTPAVALRADQQSDAGLHRCWWFTCREENINPKKAVRLPLLFALDEKLKITNGFHYIADCKSVRRQSESSNTGSTVYCGGDFGGSGFDGDGFGGSAASDSGGSSDDGGGGCGGGD